MKTEDTAKFYYQLGAIRVLEAIEDGSLPGGIPLGSGRHTACSKRDSNFIED